MANPEPCSALIRPVPLPEDPTLAQLAEAANEAHKHCEKFKLVEQAAAQQAIGAAFQCGEFLRRAKKILPHGEFQKWVRRTQNFTVRTAQQRMEFHQWARANEALLIAARPHSLRQAYILAGILPEDEPKKRLGESDGLSKLRRIGRKFCLELAANRDYEEIDDLQKIMQPVIEAYKDVCTGGRSRH